MNKHENESMAEKLLTRLHLAEETQDALLYGHRPVMFYDPGEAATLLPSTAMDILLVRDNRIVASSAKDERYAAGRLFYVRSPRQYAVLQRDCGQMAAAIQATRFLAFAHNRGIALGSGALQEDTDLTVMEGGQPVYSLIISGE